MSSPFGLIASPIARLLPLGGKTGCNPREIRQLNPLALHIPMAGVLVCEVQLPPMKLVTGQFGHAAKDLIQQRIPALAQKATEVT